MQQGPMQRGVAAKVKALRAAGRLEDVDAALVAAVQQLAKAVDKYPARASLWKEFLSADERLSAVGGEKDTDAFAELLADLRASVEHPETS